MAKLNIAYSEHAKNRMVQRKLTEGDVEYALENYDTRYTDKKGNPILMSDVPGRGRIKIVIDAHSTDPIKVITVADRR
jgi:hypothetical protein